MGRMEDLSFHSQLEKKRNQIEQNELSTKDILIWMEESFLLSSFSVHSLKRDDSALRDVGGVIFLWFGFSVGSASTPICSSTSSFSSPSVLLPADRSLILFLISKQASTQGLNCSRVIWMAITDHLWPESFLRIFYKLNKKGNNIIRSLLQPIVEI